MMQYPVRAGGVRTRVLECGSGERHVVCLHGAGSRADRWAPQLERFAEAGWHAWAFDLPGHGLAEKGRELTYTAGAFADVVEQFVDDVVGAGPIVVMGTSLGGHVGATFAGRRPELVAALVLVGAVGLVARGEDRPAASPITDTGLDGVRRKLEFLVHDPALVDDRWVLEEARINSSPGAVDALAEVARYSAVHQDQELAADALRRSGVPTMLCWGESDRWVPLRHGLAAAEVLPEAEFVTVPRTAHAPYFEDPEAYFSLVEPFCSEHVAPVAEPVR